MTEEQQEYFTNAQLDALEQAGGTIEVDRSSAGMYMSIPGARTHAQVINRYAHSAQQVCDFLQLYMVVGGFCRCVRVDDVYDAAHDGTSDAEGSLLSREQRTQEKCVTNVFLLWSSQLASPV